MKAGMMKHWNNAKNSVVRTEKLGYLFSPEFLLLADIATFQIFCDSNV